MKIKWSGKGKQEVGSYNGKIIIKVHPKYFRSTEVFSLLGDASKAKKKQNWSPKVSFQQLVKEMVDQDLKLANK